jgi:parallel beta-helix repeat protein
MIQNLLRKSFPLIIICLLIGSVSASVPSIYSIKNKSIKDGATLYVGGNGPGNYTTIQDAINDAVSGDTVFVFDDKSPYYENLIVEKSINLIGESRETTIIDGGEELDVIFIMNADGVSISGFTIQNSGVLWINHGINIHSSYNTIIDNIIRHNKIGIGLYTAGGPISNYNNITNNIIEENENKGIYLYQSKYNIISTNNIISNKVGGMILDQSSSNTVSNNVFINDGVGVFDSYQNSIMNNTVNGKPLIYLDGKSDMVINEDAGQIILVNCNKITVQNQNLSKGCIGITLINTQNSIISDNTVSSNDWYGILLFNSKNNNISMNLVSDCYSGIVLYNSDENILCYNIVSLNKYSGICLLASNNNTLSSNSIENNGGRKFIESREGLRLLDSSDNIINNNNFLKNAFAAYFSGKCLRNTWDGNYWNRPRIIPKIIIGNTGGIIFTMRFNVDWHPAKVPYDI